MSEFSDTVSSGPDWFMVVFIGTAVLIGGVFLLVVVKGLAEWNRNNNSPLLTVPAVVVAKRPHHSTSHNAEGHSSSSTSYSVTFEVKGGDRIELFLPSREYGLIAEGDRGQLTHQGSRYKGFDRTPQDR